MDVEMQWEEKGGWIYMVNYELWYKEGELKGF